MYEINTKIGNITDISEIISTIAIIENSALFMTSHITVDVSISIISLFKSYSLGVLSRCSWDPRVLIVRAPYCFLDLDTSILQCSADETSVLQG